MSSKLEDSTNYTLKCAKPKKMRKVKRHLRTFYCNSPKGGEFKIFI